MDKAVDANELAVLDYVVVCALCPIVEYREESELGMPDLEMPTTSMDSLKTYFSPFFEDTVRTIVTTNIGAIKEMVEIEFADCLKVEMRKQKESGSVGERPVRKTWNDCSITDPAEILRVFDQKFADWKQRVTNRYPELGN